MSLRAVRNESQPLVPMPLLLRLRRERNESAFNAAQMTLQPLASILLLLRSRATRCGSDTSASITTRQPSPPREFPLRSRCSSTLRPFNFTMSASQLSAPILLLLRSSRNSVALLSSRSFTTRTTPISYLASTPPAGSSESPPARSFAYPLHPLTSSSDLSLDNGSAKTSQPLAPMRFRRRSIWRSDESRASASITEDTPESSFPMQLSLRSRCSSFERRPSPVLSALQLSAPIPLLLRLRNMSSRRTLNVLLKSLQPFTPMLL
mmetsp:Transcript_4272/g.12221  ORF Transcript_4272/g.12221 Transcript_4272/m.12221 type:complete len:264 (-) Transcript_4272:6102-6893(-)